MLKMTDQLVTLLLALGGWTVVGAGIFKWMGDRLAQRIGEKWTRDREIELEQFRAISGQSQTVLSATLATFASGHGAAQERRLNAVEQIWRAFVAIRTQVPALTVLAEILTDDEFAALDAQKGLPANYTPTELMEETKRLMVATHEVESHRPFVGELAWARFYMYRAVSFRLLVIFETGLRTGKFTPWRKDSGMQQLLSSALTEDELATVMSRSLAPWYSTRNILEGKFLQEVHGVISGKHASDASLGEATRILEAAQRVQLNSGRSRE